MDTNRHESKAGEERPILKEDVIRRLDFTRDWNGNGSSYDLGFVLIRVHSWFAPFSIAWRRLRVQVAVGDVFQGRNGALGGPQQLRDVRVDVPFLALELGQ